MPENWEIHWEDYYEILQIHPSAEPEIIEAAYRKLAQKYHPDANKDPAAGERMKKINLAHEVLSNPEKRKRYDSEWFRKGSVTGKSSLPKPKPVVDPEYIYFKDVEPGETQTASFAIRNAGGPYAKMLVMNPDSWVRVVRGFSLTDSDELPAQVEIEATGENWNETYSETIRVRLDEEETQVNVELQTKPAPVREKVKVGAKPRTGPTYTPPPPVSLKHGMPGWGKWMIGLAVLCFVVLLISQPWSSNSSPSTISQTPSTQDATSAMRAGPTLLKGHFYLDAPGINDLHLRGNLNEWLIKTYPDLAKSRDMFGDPDFTIEDYASVGNSIWVISSQQGNGYIFYSADDGNSWEIQWRENDEPWNRSYPFIVYFSNKTEGWVGSKDGLFYTNDGGKNWEFRNVSGEGFYINQYWFYNNQRIVASFAYGGTYESFDGGKTWNPIRKQ